MNSRGSCWAEIPGSRTNALKRMPSHSPAYIDIYLVSPRSSPDRSCFPAGVGSGSFGGRGAVAEAWRASAPPLATALDGDRAGRGIEELFVAPVGPLEQTPQRPVEYPAGRGGVFTSGRSGLSRQRRHARADISHLRSTEPCRSDDARHIGDRPADLCCSGGRDANLVAKAARAQSGHLEYP